jgi:hypothetical protein
MNIRKILLINAYISKFSGAIVSSELDMLYETNVFYQKKFKMKDLGEVLKFIEIGLVRS